MFEITTKSKNFLARTGIIKTSHGPIETPAYVIVGTNAKVRTLTPKDLETTKTQVVIANTYHLWQKFNLTSSQAEFPGLHKLMDWPNPIMTDSGGFQVFSLGFGREHRIGKIGSMFPGEKIIAEKKSKTPKAIIKILQLILSSKTKEAKTKKSSYPKFDPSKNLVRITENGVFFKNEKNEEIFLGPKESISIQKKLGADIIIAFDECTSPLHDYKYTKNSLERTHAWAKICLEEHSKHNHNQLLYGVIQGGEWQDLREESAHFIGSLPFDGFAIGGPLGKTRKEMLKILDWTVPILPENKPRHLLGIGKIEDLFDGVERGIDTFDCVIPTREARHGAIWTKKERYNIRKNKYKNDVGLLDPRCSCQTCAVKKTRKKDLHELFKDKDKEAAHLATIHNVSFFNNIISEIRTAIKNNALKKYRREVLRS